MDVFNFKQYLETALAEATPETEAALMAQLEETLATWRAKNHLPSSLDKVMKLMNEINLTGVLPTLPEELAHYHQFKEILTNFIILQQFTLAISRGDLNQSLAVKGRMAGSLRSLQASLRHLTWQTQQIAKGYFSQRVDFMGEFSAAFNHMTASLARTDLELKQAKEAAEAANHAKSIFMATMSHELRTPLHGILGYAQILQLDDTLTASQKEKLAVIEQSGKHLLMLIEDVLDITTIEMGKVEFCPAQFHLPTLLKNISTLMQIQADSRDITFQFEIDYSHLPTMVYGDEKRLRQVLINLLGNAIKFTDRGQVTLRIGIGNQEFSIPNSSKIRFEITDTGIGIAPQDLEIIFRPFQQIGDLNRRAEGTGLGLAICRSFVELMGGELHVTSTLGQGSRFWFDLVLPESDNQPETAPFEQTNKPAVAPNIESMIIPPPELLASLLNSVLIGDIKEIQDKLIELALLDPQFKPFVDEIQRLTKGFQLNKIRSLLEGVGSR